MQEWTLTRGIMQAVYFFATKIRVEYAQSLKEPRVRFIFGDDEFINEYALTFSVPDLRRIFREVKTLLEEKGIPFPDDVSESSSDRNLNSAGVVKRREEAGHV